MDKESEPLSEVAEITEASVDEIIFELEENLSGHGEVLFTEAEVKPADPDSQILPLSEWSAGAPGKIEDTSVTTLVPDSDILNAGEDSSGSEQSHETETIEGISPQMVLPDPTIRHAEDDSSASEEIGEEVEYSTDALIIPEPVSLPESTECSKPEQADGTEIIDVFGDFHPHSISPDPGGLPVEEDLSRSEQIDGTVTNVVVEDPSPGRATARQVPLFLGADPDFLEMRQPSISERDADRAMHSLAEARARVDQSGLIRIPTEDPLSKEVPQKAPDTSTVSGDVDENLPEPNNSGLRIERAFHERIAHFGDCAQNALGAEAVVICDNDGFLLYKSPGGGAEGALEAGLLLEVSSEVTRLLGLEQSTATQIADGKGSWQCLISNGSKTGKLFVGFSLREPLEQGEIENWTKALAEAADSEDLGI